VESAQDVLEELTAPLQRSLPLAATESMTDSAACDPLLAALGHDPVTLDALSARTGWDVSTLNVKLLQYELDGQVARLPGGFFQRRVGV
jgi:DNA processing protein